MPRKPKQDPPKTGEKRALRGEPQPTRARATTLRGNWADPLTDPRKRELQIAAYNLYVIDGRSYRSIGEELRIDREVASAYVRLEADRRAAQREHERNAEIERSVSLYNDIAREYRNRMDRPGARGDEGRYVIQARERVDKLLGLEAPLKIRDETPPAPAGVAGVAAANVTTLLRMAIAAQKEPSPDESP